tara:strand:+ start:2709 stop:3383 length:675 start_codon:yes stop_codon:yes gene_type:complete
MATKTKRRKNIRKRNNKKKNTRKKTIKKKTLFSKKELSKIDKIIHQLETDINFITSGTKKQVKDKKKKLKTELNYLSSGIHPTKGQKGGGKAAYIGGAVVIGYLGLLAFGVDAPADPSEIIGSGDEAHTAFEDSEKYWLNFFEISQSMATMIFGMLARVASRLYFKKFSEMMMASMGCNRYVKQSNKSQEDIDKKNKSYYAFEETLRSMGMAVNMGCMILMMAT